MTEDLPARTRREVETFVGEWVREENVPGASVAVVDESGVRYVAGFGARDRARNAPATPRTLYGVGSCTKSVTATAIMQLVESGDVGLDDPVGEYLPHLDDVPGDPVTVHDLLCHSSGLPSDGNLSALLTQLTGRGDGDAGLPMADDEDFRRHVESSVGERLTDRERFFYYNTGYTLLGVVIEAETDRPYEAAVAETVLDPLDMSRSCFSRTAFENEPDRMTPYNREDGSAVEGSLAFDERLYAPGGLLSSVSEMATYVRMYLGEGTVDGTTVLSPASVETMTERHATRDDYLDEREQGYGYGLSAEAFLDDTLVGHGGMMGTTTAWFGYLENAGVGAVVACNTAPERHPTAVGQAVLALVQGADPHETVPAYALDRKADPLVGEYAAHREVRTATVQRAGAGLKIEADDPGWSETYRAFPESLDPDDHRYYTVTDRGKRVPVEFRVTDDDVSLLLQRWRLHKK
jgi:CubicO group peptidase (beta-lactamase class C family)